MLVKSGIIASGSGSVGGVTWSHNRFGAYIRNRSIPTNPSSAAQVTARSAFASLAGDWANLSVAQRLAWTTYADNVPVLNALGDSIILTGFNMYIRSNVPRIVAGLAAIDDGPTVMSLPTLTLPTLAITLTSTFQTLGVGYDNGDDWATETGGALLISASRERALTVNFFKGPFRYTENVLGDTTTPPTSPASIIAGFTGTIGNQASIQVRASNADGRLSSPLIITDTIE